MFMTGQVFLINVFCKPERNEVLYRADNKLHGWKNLQTLKVIEKKIFTLIKN